MDAAGAAAHPGPSEPGARPRVLVCTTVHQADDPRVRRRTVGVLATAFTVRYAASPPAPATRDDHEWVPLRGGRLRRNLAAARQCLRGDVDVISLHDPELIPAGLAARWLRRRPVVIDVHEDVPGQVLTKRWLPAALRRPAAAAARGLLRLAESHLAVTLAEAGYAKRFRVSHPVLPNHPLVADLPAPCPSDGSVVYLGDVTEARGALVALRAVAALDPPPRLRLIGRCAAPLRRRLTTLAAEVDVDLDLPGFLAHDEAMGIVAGAGVGLCPLADIPNYRHSLPTKVLEYLACGVPVVASDLPGTATVVDGLPGVRLVPPGDEAAWARAIGEALADDTLRAAAADGAADVRRRYAWPADALLATYRGLLDGGGCPLPDRR